MAIIRIESWNDIWPEVNELGKAHFQEVDGGVEPRREFRLDSDMLSRMYDAGIFKIITARDEAGSLLGYFTWTIGLDTESLGLKIGTQNALYLVPGHPALAHDMWEVSIALLRGLGVQCIFPHHRTQGRGQGLGKFFRRRGAKLIQHTYCLWIGENPHA